MLITDIEWVNQRILRDFASEFERANEQLSLDDALPVMAASSVLIDYKNVPEDKLKYLMKSIKKFIGSKKKFLNLTKEAIIEGLREEWLPTLTLREKDNILSDYKIFQEVDDDGFLVVNTTLYQVFLSHSKKWPDTFKYGTLGYKERSASGSRTSQPKEKLTVAKPDKQLAEKLSPYIEWYKKYFDYIVGLEAYKWKAIQTFQEILDIDAEDLRSNLKEALKDEVNLLSGGSYNFSKDVLLKNALHSPEEVRFLLRNLFDESVVLTERVQTFIDSFRELHAENQKAGKLKPTEQHNCNDHAVSVYLAFRHPNKHYIYKYTVWYDAIEEMQLDYPSLSRFACTLDAYNQICDQIRNVLVADKELVNMHDNAYPRDLSNYHLLTQDFLYSIAQHFQGLDQQPKQYD